MSDVLICDWIFPPCPESAVAAMTYEAPDGHREKALCPTHFRGVEEILWARGLTWSAEPVGVSRTILGLRDRATEHDLANRFAEARP